MELRHLRYFVAVAEAENVTRAAAKLHVSQPGISRQIKDLEDEIGFPLFERSAKSLRLTAAGKVFFAEAKEVLSHADAAVMKAKAVAHGGSGEIHVGYAPSITVQILPRALRMFQAQFPGVKVALHDLSTEEMLAGLRGGRLDLALTVRLPEKDLRGLRFHELARYPMQVATAPTHSLATRKNLKLVEIAGEPLLGYDRKNYPEYHTMLDRIFSVNKPRLAEEHEGVSSLIAAVEAGRGIALVPSCLECMVGARLRLISLQPAGPAIIVGALVGQGKVPLLVEKFIAAALLEPQKE